MRMDMFKKEHGKTITSWIKAVERLIAMGIAKQELIWSGEEMSR